MAVQHSAHPRVHSSSHGSHASAHAAHAASKARPSLTAEEGEGGGFAAQLLKAQPSAAKDLQAADARPKAEAAKKPSDDKDGQASADARDGKDGKDDKDAKADARPPLDPGEDLLGVGELRDHVGAHERGDLDPADPGRREQVDEADLVRGRDRLRLVLEPVPRSHLAHRHTLWQFKRHPCSLSRTRSGAC